MKNSFGSGQSNLTAKGTFVKRSHVGDYTVVESFVTFDGELIEPEAMTCYVNGGRGTDL